MLNLRLISKIFGSLLLMEAWLMFWCLVIAICHGGNDIFAFSASIVLTIAGGVAFRLLGRNADNLMTRRDSYLVVTVTWILFSLFGMLPFMLCPTSHLSLTDAFFESMSGFTTTGATIIDDVEALPKGLLFWRSLTQWIGGLGIVFFTIAILPSMVKGSVMRTVSWAQRLLQCREKCLLLLNSVWLVISVVSRGQSPRKQWN